MIEQGTSDFSRPPIRRTASQLATDAKIWSRNQQAKLATLHKLRELHPHEYDVLLQAARLEAGLTADGARLTT